ncbi:substrate-binding protein [Geobacter pelophilus]|uniref:Substrate-binding protein n=1 Tax=Geoanaerobacter pelophilus TaxID=60036 RepID=A0AAW4KZ38_9BACT|nr:substrate-binding protein [Geoanaerobacter pelophilus]MBT0663197.1 substrate-binding protein [Geoanaerobacter pelophilus]
MQLSMLNKLIICCLFLLFSPLTTFAAQETVKIGLNYPETGSYAKQGLDQRRAAELAAEEINAAGGILGEKVQLVYRDTKTNAKIAKANAVELYDKEGVPMIFGGSASSEAIETGQVALQKNKLFFGTLTYSTETTGEYGHRHIFRECYDSYFAAKALESYLKKNFSGKKFFYITSNYTWGWTTESVIRAVSSTTDVDKHPEVLTPLGATDFSKALAQARDSKAKVLVLSLFGRDMEIAVKQAHKMGLKNKMQIIVPNLNDDMAQGAGPEAMEGIVGTIPWIWSVPMANNYPKGIAFVRNFEAKYKRYPTTSGASAYIILHQYKDAVERAGTFETKAVIKALEGHKYVGVKDEQYWRDWDHQSVQSVYTVRCKKASEVKKSKYQQDCFKVISVMKGDDAAVDFKEWSEIRNVIGMPPALDEYHTEK